MDVPMKQPSALLPIIMSVAALALVLGHVAIYGVELPRIDAVP